MFAKILTSRNINKTIDYNEKKVGQGVAICLYAGNFLKDAPELALLEKKQWFGNIIALNHRIKRSALHIPISFGTGEKIPNDKMIDIARDYMDLIGFGQQPYLVYRHSDTAISHFHIVTTPIRADGSSIDLRFIGKYKSNPARKILREKYGLATSQKQAKAQSFDLKPSPAESIQYGKRPTKEAINNVLVNVLGKYKYRSLPELNAVLKLYNLKADPGKPGSKTHRHQGLVYRVLNEQGVGVGVPLRASSFHFNPGLKWLEEKFKSNPQQIDLDVQRRIRSAVGSVIAKRPASWKAFSDALRQEQIAAVPEVNAKGHFNDLSFVDLAGKTVVKTSELGKGYSKDEILNRLWPDKSLKPLPYELTQKSNKKERHPSRNL
jgi:hypothetical protein